MLPTYRILIADDSAVIRKELRSILEKTDCFLVDGEAQNGCVLMERLNRGVAADALILDLSMPEMSGIEALRRIRRADYVLKVLVLTLNDDPGLLCACFIGGANGYMLKDDIAQELPAALHAILADRIYLSPRMNTKVPHACRVKAFAGQQDARSIEHCLENIRLFKD